MSSQYASLTSPADVTRQQRRRELRVVTACRVSHETGRIEGALLVILPELVALVVWVAWGWWA